MPVFNGAQWVRGCLRRLGLRPHLSRGIFVILVGLACHDPVSASPREYSIGVFVLDRVDTAGLPAHLRSQHPLLVRHLEIGVRRALQSISRLQIKHLPPVPVGESYALSAAQAVDFVVTLELEKAHKVFANETRYPTRAELQDEANLGPRDGGTSYEVVSRPAVNAQFEVSLIDPSRDRSIWSALRDSTALVPHSEQLYIYNAWKYPGASSTALVRTFLADLLRLQEANRWVERALNVSDRWYLSQPGQDLRAAKELMLGLAGSFVVELERHLPLEGRIQSVLPTTGDDTLFLLDLGAGARPPFLPTPTNSGSRFSEPAISATGATGAPGRISGPAGAPCRCRWTHPPAGGSGRL